MEKGQTLPVDSTTDLSDHAPFVPAARQLLGHALVRDAYQRRARVIEGLNDSTEYQQRKGDRTTA